MSIWDAMARHIARTAAADAPRLTVTGAGLMEIDGVSRHAILLEGPLGAIRAAAALLFQDVAIVPVGTATPDEGATP